MKKMTVFIVCGILCFIYCMLIFSVHSGGKFYIFWALMGLFFIGLSYMSHIKIWDRLSLPVKKTAAGIMITGVIIFLAVEGLIVSCFGAKGEPELDYIIVLGAQVREDGPSTALKYRLDRAYEYLSENEDTMCIVSGGRGRNEPFSEAEGMYDYLVKKGIDPQRIILENKSADTSENIAFSMAYLDKDTDSVGVVTNNFHIFRGVNIARHNGIKQVCGISAKSDMVYLLNNMVREFFGIFKDLVCGNLI